MDPFGKMGWVERVTFFFLTLSLFFLPFCFVFFVCFFCFVFFFFLLSFVVLVHLFLFAFLSFHTLQPLFKSQPCVTILVWIYCNEKFYEKIRKAIGKAVLKNFSILTGKQLRFCEIFKNIFFSEHLQQNAFKWAHVDVLDDTPLELPTITAQKNFSINYFFSKCDQICSLLRIRSHLVK